MNKLDIVRDNDFPVTAKTFRFLQDTYQEFQHLGRLYGSNCILYGCELLGGNRTAGALMINGELIPFLQSPNNTKIKVFEEIENAIYKGGESLPAYYTRYAKCDITGNIVLADLPRVVIKTAPQPKETDWENCVPTGQINVVEPVQVRFNENGLVQMRGKFSHTGDWAYSCDFLLPANNKFTPKYDKVIPIRHAEGSTTADCLMHIQSDGRCILFGAAGNILYMVNSEF